MHYPIVRIAHRGASVEYPENTLLAFRRALEQGVDMLELDVHLTRDGELVVIHDATLERTTNGAGFVRDHPCSAIRRLDAGRDERIPMLAEVINLVRSTAVGLCVEVKVDGKSEGESLAVTEAVIKALEKAGFLGRTIVTSFLPAVLLRAKVLQPHQATLLDPSPQDGTLSPRQICEQTLAAGANCISYDHRFVTQAVADETRLAGLSLWPWDPDNSEDIGRVLRLGVPGVMTNRPAELNRALNNLSLNPGLHSIASH